MRLRISAAVPPSEADACNVVVRDVHANPGSHMTRQVDARRAFDYN